MKKTTILLNHRDFGRVPAWGVLIGANFAWTPMIPHNYTPADLTIVAPPCNVTHVHTGRTVNCHAATLAKAKAIVARLEAVPGMDWTATDAKKIDATAYALPPTTLAELRCAGQWDGASVNDTGDLSKPAPKKRKPSALEKLLASPAWEGSTVETRDELCAEDFGLCTKADCALLHAEAWARVNYNKTKVDVYRRHAILRKMHVVTHPSGAIARVLVTAAELENAK